MKKTTKRLLVVSLYVIIAGILFVTAYLIYQPPIRFTMADNSEIIELPYYKHLLFEWFDMEFDIHYECPEYEKRYATLENKLLEQSSAIHIAYSPSFFNTTHLYACKDSIVFYEQSRPVPQDSTKTQFEHRNRFYDIKTIKDVNPERSQQLLSQLSALDIFKMKSIMKYRTGIFDGVGVNVETKLSNEFNYFIFNACEKFDDKRYEKIVEIFENEAARLNVVLNRKQ